MYYNILMKNKIKIYMNGVRFGLVWLDFEKSFQNIILYELFAQKNI